MNLKRSVMNLTKHDIRATIQEIDKEENQLLAQLNHLIGVRDAYKGLLNMENIPETIEDDLANEPTPAIKKELANKN